MITSLFYLKKYPPQLSTFGSKVYLVILIHLQIAYNEMCFWLIVFYLLSNWDL